MTSQGQPWAIFDRAIKADNLPSAIAAAYNLNANRGDPPMVADQSLRLLLLYLREDPMRYPRAAARWATAATTQTKTITVGGLADLADALNQLPNEPGAGARDLAELASTLGLPDLSVSLAEHASAQARP